MFTTAGLKSLHAGTHSSLAVLSAHLPTMHADILVAELPGFERRKRDVLGARPPTPAHAQAARRRLQHSRSAELRRGIAETLKYRDRLGELDQELLRMP
jgi:hypothetical protein